MTMSKKRKYTKPGTPITQLSQKQLVRYVYYLKTQIKYLERRNRYLANGGDPTGRFGFDY